MRRPSRAGLSLVLAFCAGIPLAAQNLESIGREKPFSFSGGLAFNQVFYASSGIDARRDPYNYIASGNLNLSLYGWTIPLTFTLSNRNSTFSQPFNQYSLHPTWKWITAHAGYTSMSFSPYTVNGHTFLGGAIDLAPEGNWKLSALHGRFLKAIGPDTATAHSPSPSFQRMGYGLKVSYGKGGNFVDLILFRAEDEAASADIPDSIGVKPQQNLVTSLGAGTTLFKHFALKTEIAASAITKDTRTEKISHSHPLAKAGKLFEPRLSSAYYQALKMSLDYQKDAWIIGFAYERIDPGYSTLGAYYFNNDLENITLNGSAGVLRGKMNLTASTGIQHDNLDKTKVSTMRRMVGAVNLNYIPSKQFNLLASYSSFQTYTNIRSQFETINQLTPYDNLDTLNFTQISRNASFSGTYTLPGAENRRQTINVNLTWQDAADKQGEAAQTTGTRFYNINTGYAVALAPRNMNLAATFNTTINRGPFIQTQTMGPTASVTKTFFNRKFRTTLSSSYNNTYTNGIHVNAVATCRFNGAITVRKKHHFNLSTVVVKRTSRPEGAGRSFTELTGTLGYRYNFGSP